MASKHPYVSSPGNLIKVINHFRKSFPSNITANTLKQLGFAPKNESYILNILRYLGLIDQSGTKTEQASKVFSLHDDATFSKEFDKLVKKAYVDLFNLYGDNAFGLDKTALITFFRQSNETTDLVGKSQASTFQALAALSGHGNINEKVSTSKQSTSAPKAKAAKKKPLPTAEVKPTFNSQKEEIEKKHAFGLTVRIEINLPADGDQETYNRIFKSIRENLLNV